MSEPAKKTELYIGISILLFLVLPGLRVQCQNPIQTEIPVVIKPMKVGNDTVPVEIQCEPVFITRPDTLDRFTCTLINKTNKGIGASSVRYSVVVDSNGKEERVGRFDTAVPLIHPDLLEAKKPIEPGGTLFVMPVGPISEPNSVIKWLELEPMYLEFSDGTTAGIGGDAAELIAKVRDGAVRYKSSLRQEYLNKGKSTQAILPLLQDGDRFGLETLNGAQLLAAKAYRKFLREKYEKEGIEAVNKILEK